MSLLPELKDATAPTVLAISSQVARGHIGLSAISPVLQCLGVNVVAVPTIILSNHPGHAHKCGLQIEPAVISGMVSALERNGWLSEIDAFLVGYLPTPEHVTVAAETIARVRTRRNGKSLVVLCDPVIGDDPKGIYIDKAAAEAIKSDLVPFADILTPNRFEASWLSGIEVADPSTALAAARKISDKIVIVTSVPQGADQLANIAVTETGSRMTVVTRRQRVPNGTGDAFAALLLASFLRHDTTTPEALARATGRIDTITAASAGHSELLLIEDAATWVNAPAMPLSVVTRRS